MAELKLTGDEARAIVRAAHPGGSDHPQGIDYVRATIEYLNRRELEASAAMGQVPEGWKIEREGLDVIRVTSPNGVFWPLPLPNEHKDSFLATFFEAMLAAAPTPPATSADDSTRLEWLMLKTCVDDLGIEMPFGIDQSEYFKRFRAAIDAAIAAAPQDRGDTGKEG